MERTDSQFIGAIASGEMMSRFLDGYVPKLQDEFDEPEIDYPLTKSYLLESARDVQKIGSIMAIMNRNHITLEPIDDQLYRVFDQARSEYMGFLEVVPPRFFVFYTMRRSEESDRWIRKITRIRELDHIWLSHCTFKVLWQKIVQLNEPHRYAKIGFRSDNIFQIDQESFRVDETDTPTRRSDKISAEERNFLESAPCTLTVKDQIMMVQEKLDAFQEIYSPHTISLIRFPSPLEQGGHDFYDNGKVINGSGNFEDHRNHLQYMLRIYNHLLNYTEEKIWHSLEKETVTIPGVSQKLVGVPVWVKFGKPLSDETFKYWLDSTFSRMDNRFRLWGNPIHLGPQKVHVYAVDQHLWQPFFLEITPKHLMAVIPTGICGNTVHRLVTNIQRYLDPAVEVFIGNSNYENLVAQSTQGVIYERVGYVLQ